MLYWNIQNAFFIHCKSLSGNYLVHYNGISSWRGQGHFHFAKGDFPSKLSIWETSEGGPRPGATGYGLRVIGLSLYAISKKVGTAITSQCALHFCTGHLAKNISLIFFSSLGSIQAWSAAALRRLFQTQCQPLPSQEPIIVKHHSVVSLIMNKYN